MFLPDLFSESRSRSRKCLRFAAEQLASLIILKICCGLRENPSTISRISGWMDFSSPELPPRCKRPKRQDGLRRPKVAALHATNKENLMMSTRVSQWQRIALLAAALSASMVSTAWGGVPGLYQVHLDGSIWQYTGEPCEGSSCLGWVELDNNPITATIAAGAGKLYQVHTDGTIWSYTGPPCSGSSCPGWVKIERQSNHWSNWHGRGRSLSDAQRRLALAIPRHALQRQLLSWLVETRSEPEGSDFCRRGRLFV